MPHLEAVIFDMDGVLIDSEPFWAEAEAEVFTTLGIPMTVAMSGETTGLRVDEVVEYWLQRYPAADTGRPVEHLAEAIVDGVMRRVREGGKALPGGPESIDFLTSTGARLAVASSSPLKLIDCVLDTLDIRTTFGVVHSAQHETYGKPHPAVYETTLRMLDADATNVVAIEDSRNGIAAAKAAGLMCIAVPDRHAVDRSAFAAADYVVKTLHEIDTALLTHLGFTVRL